MTGVRLVLEHAPSAQSETEFSFQGGQLTVGRGEDVDWRIHDPSNFVSRKHFVISEEKGEFYVTDASSGGLFVDQSSEPLGPGHSFKLKNGTRLLFGDFVARIEMASRDDVAQAGVGTDVSPFDFSFDAAEANTPSEKRPASLPEPFGSRSSAFFGQDAVDQQRPPEPIDRDDPFALGLRLQNDQADDLVPGPNERDVSSSAYFASNNVPPLEEQEEELEPAKVSKTGAPVIDDAVEKFNGLPQDAIELRNAFFSGLGLDPQKYPSENTTDEMEALGKRFRTLADGVAHLLRTRASEKQQVRIAQTIVGSQNVNPLKFAVSADDAVASLVVDRGEGYLGADNCIDEAFRDLIDHQIRTWAALQTALRRMVEKFDPEAIERELEDTGLLETLIAGGRSAKLWQLYQERFEEIAKAAEERFLGEIGSDFRDAYEDQ